MITKFIGGWLMLDGIGSMMMYPRQRFVEHVPRMFRACLGFGMLVLPVAV